MVHLKRVMVLSIFKIPLIVGILSIGGIVNVKAQTSPASPVVAPDFFYPGVIGFAEKVLNKQKSENKVDTRWGEKDIANPDPRVEWLRDGQVQRLVEDKNDTIAMQKAEWEALNDQRGVWANECCRLVSVQDTASRINAWGVVDGTVLNVVRIKKMIYLNFGTDWKTDFTVMVPMAIARKHDLYQLKGNRIIVRGWVRQQSGPAIIITTLDQIQLWPTGKTLLTETSSHIP